MHRFFPVLHASNDMKINLKNLDLCQECGVNGVFLINHGNVSPPRFYHLVNDACIIYKNYFFKVGVNYLNLTNLQALTHTISCGADMLWVDNAGFDSHVQGIKEDLDQFDFYSKSRNQSHDNDQIEIFGGVHFKYQSKPMFEIEKSVHLASPFITITLSGPATAKAANLDFVKKAHAANPGADFALASGISAENVRNYMPYVKNFLVASSILNADGESFNKEKMRELREIIYEGI